MDQHPNSYLVPSKPRRTRKYSIVDFYDPEIMACDYRGRVLEDIVDWSDTRLEESHNYIQVSKTNTKMILRFCLMTQLICPY